MKKRFLFYVGHPAHFHFTRVVAGELADKGHAVLLVARDKDVLFDLLDGCSLPVVKFRGKKKAGKIGLLSSVLQREFRMMRQVRRFNPDLLLGTDPVIAHVGRLTGIPSAVINEDDVDAVPLMGKVAYPFATHILAPECCDVGKWSYKKWSYRGNHELVYLHPNRFTPDADMLKNWFDAREPYFILRFASLVAHHDTGKSGITDDIALDIIERIGDKGKVFITSERPLTPRLEKYRMPIPPNLIHHALAFAKMVIGDSQTMTAEAAVLGTPAIRFNDFVGELSYLEELEHRYGLTRGFRTHNLERFLQQISHWIDKSDLQEELKTGRDKLIKDCGDVAYTWVDQFLQWAK